MYTPTLRDRYARFRYGVAQRVIRLAVWLANHISYDSSMDIFLEEFEDCGYCPDCDGYHMR